MKKIAYIVTVIILLIIINGLFHSVWDLWNKQNLLTQAQLKLDQEKTENGKLKKQLTLVQSKSFIESEARNKLFMEKPGETNVIIPDSMLPKENKSHEAQNLDLEGETLARWINLFFPK